MSLKFRFFGQSRNFAQKSYFWSKVKIFVKSQNFAQKRKIPEHIPMAFFK